MIACSQGGTASVRGTPIGRSHPIASAAPSTIHEQRVGPGRDEPHVRMHQLMLVRQIFGGDLQRFVQLAAAGVCQAAGGDLVRGQQVVVDLPLALGHLQHRLLVGPVGLERVEASASLQVSRNRADRELGRDEETEVRRLAHQRSRKRWKRCGGIAAAGGQSQQREADQAAIRKTEQHASVRHCIGDQSDCRYAVRSPICAVVSVDVTPCLSPPPQAAAKRSVERGGAAVVHEGRAPGDAAQRRHLERLPVPTSTVKLLVSNAPA